MISAEKNNITSLEYIRTRIEFQPILCFLCYPFCFEVRRSGRDLYCLRDLEHCHRG